MKRLMVLAMSATLGIGLLVPAAHAVTTYWLYAHNSSNQAPSDQKILITDTDPVHSAQCLASGKPFDWQKDIHSIGSDGKDMNYIYERIIRLDPPFTGSKQATKFVTLCADRENGDPLSIIFRLSASLNKCSAWVCGITREYQILRYVGDFEWEPGEYNKNFILTIDR